MSEDKNFNAELTRSKNQFFSYVRYITPRPEGVVKMKGGFDSYHRIRIGDYRVIYSIEDKKLLILIVKIAQRGSVYKD